MKSNPFHIVVIGGRGTGAALVRMEPNQKPAIQLAVQVPDGTMAAVRVDRICTKLGVTAPYKTVEPQSLTLSFPSDPLRTVLDILERARRSREPSLMYLHSCPHGSCLSACPVTEGFMGPAEVYPARHTADLLRTQKKRGDHSPLRFYFYTALFIASGFLSSLLNPVIITC